MSTPEQPPSGPPLRAFAMVLIALAIAFAGIGAMALSGNDSEPEQQQPETTSSVARVAAGTGSASVTSARPPAAATSARPSAAITPTTTTAAAATTTAPVLDKSAVSVRVLNNSTVSGLAAQTARTIESDGWTVGETGNYADGSVSSTTVYYSASSPAEKAAATEIAATLGVSAEPRFPGIVSASPGVIVIVTAP
ncbi:LytR C-terminal domain-containing protein [Rhodococcus sp. UNC363MFTsu5.1]|uniref:LytR C-terminal domain-containing protein n=1 Tax=Rhodococcus sp. UNC363MFTsu5.1 TaxID=1449069 RepID=UPI0004867149|nr:LytR C-terminal domain-containing protein [Rhodococcus sp. UNC363MFTsu5.1]